MVTNNNIITFTDAAKSKIEEVLKEQATENHYLRIAVNNNPMGGVEYVFGLEEKPNDLDNIIEEPVRTLIDKDSAPLVEGSSIDFVEGFERSGFVISNPNFQQEGCGCGNGGGGCGCGGGGGGGGCGSGGGCGGH
ncbi:MAG: iron-sulfur cluster assembly accessory protein [Dehalococcoidia bacterium]|nr:iron-sulfur cluster assembly accessory protein [Dehalococcoidia bacterium]MQG09223.1 iron-sulfur cluster assembly accessory protein [SAR202 cluster bacterium]